MYIPSLYKNLCISTRTFCASKEIPPFLYIISVSTLQCEFFNSSKQEQARKYDAIIRKLPFRKLLCFSLSKAWQYKPLVTMFQERSVHQKYKPFKCSLCGMTFGFRDGLQRHTSMVHDQLRPYPCPRCDLKFKTKSHQKSHLYSIHGVTEESQWQLFETLQCFYLFLWFDHWYCWISGIVVKDEAHSWKRKSCWKYICAYCLVNISVLRLAYIRFRTSRILPANEDLEWYY